MNPNTEKRGVKGLVLLLVLAAAGLGVAVIWHLDSAPRTDDAYAYADTINVAPELNGRIVELAVKDNQFVKEGDVMFRLDPRPYQADLSKAEASLIELDQEIILTQRSVNAQKFGADEAAANVERARATARQAADTLARLEPLLGREFVSAEQVDQARTAKRSADAQLHAIQHEAQRATAAVSGVEALVARREVIKAEIELARLHLEYATVRAPCDGIVLDLKTAAGQYAAAGHPVFTLASTGHWYVVANFRETELAHVRPGQAALVYILSTPDKRFSGVVASVGYGVFPDDGGVEAGGLSRVPRSINWVRVAQRFPVRILVDKPDPALFRIGASAVAIMTPDSTRPVDRGAQ